MTSRPILAAAALLASLAGVTGCGARPDTAADAEKIAALQRKIVELEAEARRIQDASEIKRLQRAYGFYVDNGQWDQVADLFTDDATVEFALDGVYAGKERIRKYLYALGGGRPGMKEGQLNEHFQLQPVVHVAEDGLSAKGRWRTVIMAGQFRESALWGEGVYENEYVKQDGVWKISKLHWYQTFLVPYEGGWAKNKDVSGGKFVSDRLPPDRPPTEQYGVWPDVYTPPFHYKNPVSGR